MRAITLPPILEIGALALADSLMVPVGLDVRPDAQRDTTGPAASASTCPAVAARASRLFGAVSDVALFVKASFLRRGRRPAPALRRQASRPDADA